TASSLRTTYDIEFWYDGWEYELQMDAASGELIEYKLDRSVEHILARRSPLPQARISFEQAREIAQEQKGGGIRSLELDFYRGNWIYRATLGQGRRSWSLKFDAVTGETVTFWDWRSAQ
ncbi:MAG: PepSY domain-containing protein, partial [Oscillospiraceae bacterium]|nr:PepSY domain-containing protein [Oscillospiraceae bacterium]